MGTVIYSLFPEYSRREICLKKKSIIIIFLLFINFPLVIANIKGEYMSSIIIILDTF